jgi:hypothetical protein
VNDAQLVLVCTIALLLVSIGAFYLGYNVRGSWCWCQHWKEVFDDS